MTEVYKDLLHMRTTIVAFTCAALLISLLGLTAMSIYFISQRKRDMAIRKVFGSGAGMERARLLRFPCCLCWQACYWPFLWRGSVYSR